MIKIFYGFAVADIRCQYFIEQFFTQYISPLTHFSRNFYLHGTFPNGSGERVKEYAGVASAIKCFYGATGIHANDNATITDKGKTCYHIYSPSHAGFNAEYPAKLVGQL